MPMAQARALRLSAKVKYKSDGRASGCKCKSEVLSLSTKCNRERASLRNLEKVSAKHTILQAWRATANLTYPFPTRIV